LSIFIIGLIKLIHSSNNNGVQCFRRKGPSADYSRVQASLQCRVGR